jgi:Tol biopolymer transport system component
LNEFNDGQFAPGGALKLIDFKTDSVTTLLHTEEGVIRDPDVHFDAKKMLFSMRKNKEDSYHIYEINTDGTGLRQLTFMQDVDDIDPFYLADDHIAFSSTREPKYCGCNRHIMANLYRMEPDGSNIYQISKNLLFDGHGSLMPDGRI